MLFSDKGIIMTHPMTRSTRARIWRTRWTSLFLRSVARGPRLRSKARRHRPTRRRPQWQMPQVGLLGAANAWESHRKSTGEYGWVGAPPHAGRCEEATARPGTPKHRSAECPERHPCQESGRTVGVWRCWPGRRARAHSRCRG